ncbi:MAG: DnaJ domain [Chloroflexi bacterium]|jgi:DnaJ domain|nr:DnaJ domain [Chloroflexota bacterium]
MDWAEACRILGVPETATEAEIKEQYLYKAQLLHPDKNLDKPENIRKKAEAELALINQAFSFASIPSNNPYRIPPKLSIEPAAIHFDVNIGEKKTATLTIRNTGGPYTSVWIDNQPAPWLTVTGVNSTTGERLPLEVTLECSGIGEPDRQYSANLAIRLENENTHALDSAVVKFELHTGHKSLEPAAKRVVAPPTKKPVSAGPRYKSPPLPQNRLGFSARAFLVNLLAFAILGTMAFFVFSYFRETNSWKIDQSAILIGSIVYGAITVGVCVNHAFNVGSRADKNG